jgi:glutamate-ammonia-ligase adenylyltransferase
MSQLDPAFAASRYFTRWVQAAPDRAALVAETARAPLASIDFTRRLQAEREAGLPLERAMRRVRNLVVCTLIARDLAGQADLAEVVGTMTAFADFCIRTHVEALEAELTALHGVPTGAESGRRQHLIVLGMGKLGGGELNVSSDIDLIFVYPEDGDTVCTEAGQKSLSNHEFFIRLGKRFMKALAEIAEDGYTFRVDMALRPNGNSGPLAASLNMVEQYLIVQGREWERYAWVKARAITGQPDDIAALDAVARPFVYRRYLDFSVIDALRGMHAQIRAEVNRQERLHPDRSNNVKLGRGGIREIEFLAQVFQLIRGGREPVLRERSTRATLALLADKGLLAPDVVAQLLASYTFLRNLEHRLQYLDDAQTHTLPVQDADVALVARAMGLPDAPALLAELERHRGFVAGQFDAIFSDKQADGAEDADLDLDSHGDASGSDKREEVEARLAALGFDEPAAGAQRLLGTWQSPKLQSLPEASRHRLAALVNAALPLIARIAGAEARPTLGRLLDFLEAIARRAAYLSLLTEYPHTLERVVRMMHASGWAALYLTRHPLLLDELLDERTLHAEPDWPQLTQQLEQQLAEATGDTERQLDILREVHHAQLFRLLARDLAGDLTVERVADHLSRLADIIVSATLQACWRAIPARHRETPRFAVIAYGKLGGKELGYISDLDVIFLYDDEDQDAPALYAKLAQRFITWMTTHTPAGILFDIDTALRPDGASGMLVSSLRSFERYQHEAAWVWEHQALTRGRYCAGDAEIGARFEAIREAVLRRDRSGEAGASLKTEVLAMRRRMHDAHPPRDGRYDLKQDEGGMIDIEFIVQYLVLRHAAQYPQLTGNIGNIALLRLCGELGLIDAQLARETGDAYRALRKLQHQLRLQGDEHSRVAVEQVEAHARPVTALWAALFG